MRRAESPGGKIAGQLRAKLRGRHNHMAEQTPPHGDAEPFDLARIATEQFERALARINQVIRDLDSDPARAAKELIDETRLLRKALENIYEERKRVRTLSGSDGPAGGVVLDLAAARGEIARRLACLRLARGDGGVSGQPE